MGEDFFDGKDPEDRDFLLLNGSNDVASGDEDEHMDDHEEEVLTALRESHANDAVNIAESDAAISGKLAKAQSTDQAVAALNEAAQRLPPHLAAALSTNDTCASSSSCLL